MPTKKLLDLKRHEKGRVIGFDSGSAMQIRLESLGIRRGKTISRVSSQLLGGPIVVAVDGRQTAMGRNMAAKILVETSGTG